MDKKPMVHPALTEFALAQAKDWEAVAQERLGVIERLCVEIGRITTISDNYYALCVDANLENAKLLECLAEVKYRVEQGRVWSGMGWTLTGIHPHAQRKILDVIEAALGSNGVDV
jgi:hypothetical protein